MYIHISVHISTDRVHQQQYQHNNHKACQFGKIIRGEMNQICNSELSEVINVFSTTRPTDWLGRTSTK